MRKENITRGGGVDGGTVRERERENENHTYTKKGGIKKQ